MWQDGYTANIDFVDRDDCVIGSGTIDEARASGHIHRVARIFIYNTNGELILQKRASHMKTFPDKWDHSAAGHVDHGETYDDAAKRELMEEVGISGVDLSKREKYFSEEADEEGQVKKRFNTVYRGVYDGVVKPNPDEVSEVRWVSPVVLEDWMNERPEEFTKGFIESYAYLQRKSE
jgi:isopentenyldiphosphate isomerase